MVIRLALFLSAFVFGLYGYAAWEARTREPRRVRQAAIREELNEMEDARTRRLQSRALAPHAPSA